MAVSTESGLFPRAVWPYRALAAAGMALLAAVVVSFGLFTGTYFSDNAYNLSLVLRSAAFEIACEKDGAFAERPWTEPKKEGKTDFSAVPLVQGPVPTP